MWKPMSIAAFVALPFVIQAAKGTGEQAAELGQVHWARTLEPALKASSIDHKPILLLFQEVPG